MALPLVLTELLQVGRAGPLGHGRDGHHGTHVPAQRVAQSRLPEVDVSGVHTLLQQLQVGLGREAALVRMPGVT